ncbi:ciliary microtubule inner protein 2A [Ambystoma mexicanum]|uniref:ciliary microtubule inner protein 2A n=1 Tax=Ambystoma mexicanum TaxID=8296 RepID=UPI0037E8110B
MKREPKNSFFTPDPYYIPGYGGFYPQLRYQIGNTYGTATNNLLTDPSIEKSPKSVLAPLGKPQLPWDLGHPGDYQANSHQVKQLPLHSKGWADKYIPGYSGYMPLSKYQHGKTFGHLAADSRQEFLESLLKTNAKREEAEHLANCGQAMEPIRKYHLCPPMPRSRSLDLTHCERFPQMQMPYMLQRTAIPGYAGFIPRFTWNLGERFHTAVNHSLDEFERTQQLIRSPFGKGQDQFRPNYWPEVNIYNPDGIIPYYTGFVPGARWSYGLTFGDDTRENYKQGFTHGAVKQPFKQYPLI